MLNLLVIAKDTANFIFNESFHIVEKELAKKANVMIWRESGHILDILNQVPTTPDFILIQNDIGGKMEPYIMGLADVDIPTGLFIEDVHRFVDKRREFIKINNISYLFSNYKEIFMEIYPEFKDKFCWFPHHVNSDVFKDYQLPKDINLLLMGAITKSYPLRWKVYQEFRHDPGFVYHRHPGYRTYTKEEMDQIFVNKKYAREINRAKIFFTCGTIRNYPVMKYFEVPACRTLLLAPQLNDLDELGFIPGEHYVSINENDLYQKAMYYLEHDEKREQIAKQGFEIVHTQHTTEKRVEQLIKKMKEILGHAE